MQGKAAEFGNFDIGPLCCVRGWWVATTTTATDDCPPRRIACISFLRCEAKCLPTGLCPSHQGPSPCVKVDGSALAWEAKGGDHARCFYRFRYQTSVGSKKKKVQRYWLQPTAAATGLVLRRALPPNIASRLNTTSQHILVDQIVTSLGLGRDGAERL